MYLSCTLIRFPARYVLLDNHPRVTYHIGMDKPYTFASMTDAAYNNLAKRAAELNYIRLKDGATTLRGVSPYIDALISINTPNPPTTLSLNDLWTDTRPDDLRELSDNLMRAAAAYLEAVTPPSPPNTTDPDSTLDPYTDPRTLHRRYRRAARRNSHSPVPQLLFDEPGSMSSYPRWLPSRYESDGFTDRRRQRSLLLQPSTITTIRAISYTFGIFDPDRPQASLASRRSDSIVGAVLEVIGREYLTPTHSPPFLARPYAQPLRRAKLTELDFF